MESRNSEVERDPEDEAEVLKKALAEEKRKNDDLLTRLKYAQADLENYRKRMDKELKEAGESLAKSLVARLLVVQDELDLAARHAEGGRESAELREGLGMVRRNLQSSLESVGVERIVAVGKPFDPALHEAVEKIQGDSGREDMVVEEVRPGFKFRGQLLRPSMVKVELSSRGAEGEKKDE